MLVSVNNLRQLDITWLFNIYSDSIRNSLDDYLYDLEKSFQKYSGKMYFWEHNGLKVAAVRTEPYQDGILMFDLYTHQEHRRCGYGTELVKAVMSCRDLALPVYVHIDKRNTLSIRLHHGLGFETVCDYGKLIDGTISHRYFTLAYK